MFVYRSYEEIRSLRSSVNFYCFLAEKEVQPWTKKIKKLPFPRRRWRSHKLSEVAYHRAEVIKKWLEEAINAIYFVKAKSQFVGLAFGEINYFNKMSLEGNHIVHYILLLQRIVYHRNLV